MDKDRLTKSLNIIGRLFIDSLVKNLIKLDKVASGRLLKSLDFFVVETLNTYLI